MIFCLILLRADVLLQKIKVCVHLVSFHFIFSFVLAKFLCLCSRFCFFIGTQFLLLPSATDLSLGPYQGADLGNELWARTCIDSVPPSSVVSINCIFDIYTFLIFRSRDSSDVENPGNNLYVTGLSSRVTKRDIEKHFSTEGKVHILSQLILV